MEKGKKRWGTPPKQKSQTTLCHPSSPFLSTSAPPASLPSYIAQTPHFKSLQYPNKDLSILICNVFLNSPEYDFMPTLSIRSFELSQMKYK
jgi:hypothetical protein